MTSLLSPEQLDAFLEYISLPLGLRESREIDLKILSLVQLYYICAVPYENLGLHYSDNATIHLDVQSLYQKCTNNGRGGYCMENSIFFNHVLRALGFHAYLTGARARPRVNGVPQGDYTGWMHVVNIVKLPDGSQYMVDVGFGGDLATKPLPLVAGKVSHNFGTQDVRLTSDHIPQMASEQNLWIYQYRNSLDQDWHSAFCFTEVEFLAQDLEVMNFYTSHDPRCFQTYTLLVVKFMRGKEGICGKLMLVADEVKENLGGKTRLVKTMKSEEERIEILKELFGISLSKEEMSGIRGRSTELVERLTEV